MSDAWAHETSDEALERALTAVASDVAFPSTPPMAPAVVSRLRAEREARVRPPFPSMALWSRRRAVVLVAVGLAAVLALAFAARLVLGAAEIRVQPGAPSGTPLVPSGLGSPVPVAEVDEAVRFDVRLPAGPAPDEAYVFRTNAAGNAALFAWRADERDAALPGTPWRQMLIEIRGDEQTLVKDVGQLKDALTVFVDGRRAFWIDAPHTLIVRTPEGSETFLIRANVLIWVDGDVTYRLETTLDQEAAIELAETVG
jgi:hypothetical protein